MCALRDETELNRPRLADGPDEAHAAQLARIENKKHQKW